MLPNLPTFSVSQPCITNKIPMLFVAPSCRCIDLYMSSNDIIKIMMFLLSKQKLVKVVNKGVAWNALEIVRIDHRCYLNTIKKLALKGSIFKLDFIWNSISWISV